MMISKERLIEHINQFPDELSIDELIDRLLFVEKLEKRIEQSKNDETISEEKLKNEMQLWFKSNG